MPYVRRFTSEVILGAFTGDSQKEMSASEVARAVGAKSARAVAPTLHRMASIGLLQAATAGNGQRYRLPASNDGMPTWLVPFTPPVASLKGARRVNLLDKT